MSAPVHVADCRPQTLSEFSGPLFGAALAVVSGHPVTEAGLKQAALSVALQSCVNGAVDNGPISTINILQAHASAFGSWVATLVDDNDEAEDALIAFREAFFQTLTAVLKARAA